MRCSLKATSLGKMRGLKIGVENFSKTKKELTVIGIIMIFGAVIPYYTPDNSISCKLLFKRKPVSRILQCLRV